MAKAITMEEFNQGVTQQSAAEQQRYKEAYDKFSEFAERLKDEYGVTSYSILSNGKGLSFHSTKISMQEVASGMVQTLMDDDRLYFIFSDILNHIVRQKAAEHLFNNGKQPE